MLEIRDLTVGLVSENSTTILQKLTLTLQKGKTYALMGPNGSGKSTLAGVLAGDPSFNITNGSVNFIGANLLNTDAPSRSLMGLFVAYQNPPYISGLNISSFLRRIYNKRQKTSLSPKEFGKLLDEKMALLNLPAEFKSRSFNEGFSGGERKKMEVLQILLLKPAMAILDEIDSGVDIDSLKTIISTMQNEQRALGQTLLYITHSTVLPKMLKPERIFVLKGGKIVAEDGINIVEKVERDGYDGL